MRTNGKQNEPAEIRVLNRLPGSPAMHELNSLTLN